MTKFPGPSSETIRQQIADDIAACWDNPLKFCGYVYPWNTPELESKGPKEWQKREMRAIQRHLSNPATRFKPYKSAKASGHGIGKSAFIAMIIDWAMSTCQDCRVTVTANTEPQLRTKTWPEKTKWHNLLINRDWFEMGATSMTSKESGREKTWRADMLAWSENNTEAFSGLHNAGKRIVLIFDEASAISDKIWEVAEGALTDENTEILWFAFGNPTLNTGRFRECFGKFKGVWRTEQIDSRTVEGTNKEQIAEWAALWGEDSNFFKVRVRGEFPTQSDKQFISSALVEAARRRESMVNYALPRILSVDVARFGADQTVIGWRQGRKAVILSKLRGLSAEQVALRTIEFMDKEAPDATVVDEDGIGGPVLDIIRFRGFKRGLFGFHGGSEANRSDLYYNRRAECWGLMRDWLEEGADIPDDPELADELTGPEYELASGKRNAGTILLESKDDMKARGLSSPDCADMIAMTFSVKIAPKERTIIKPTMAYKTGDIAQNWMA